MQLPFASLVVDEINEGEHFAKVTLSYRPPRRIEVPGLVGELFGGVAVDGGGWILVNGHLQPVDPWGPLRGVLEQVVAHAQANGVADAIVALEARKSALARIVQIASAELNDLTELETPPAATRRGIAGARVSLE